MVHWLTKDFCPQLAREGGEGDGMREESHYPLDQGKEVRGEVKSLGQVRHEVRVIVVQQSL